MPKPISVKEALAEYIAELRVSQEELEKMLNDKRDWEEIRARMINRHTITSSQMTRFTRQLKRRPDDKPTPASSKKR